jgi:cell division protein FtsN
MIGHGTALVRIRAINPYMLAEKPSRNVGHRISRAAPVVTSAAKNQASRAYIYLQAGAFKNKTNANKLRNRLATLISFPVRVSHPVIAGKLYRVQIGPIHDSASAAKITQRLKAIGIKANKAREG